MVASWHRLTGATAAAAALCLAGGCTRVVTHKGYVVDSVLLDSVQPGVDNKASVTKTLGHPSFTSEFDGRTWYYWSRTTQAYAFQNPHPLNQVLLAISFDPQGNVSGVRKTGAETIASIHPYGEATPTLGRDRGFFSELFGNIGQVGAAGQAAPTTDNPN